MNTRLHDFGLSRERGAGVFANLAIFIFILHTCKSSNAFFFFYIVEKNLSLSKDRKCRANPELLNVPGTQQAPPTITTTYYYVPTTDRPT